MKMKPVLTADELDPIVNACRDRARAMGLAVTIAIVDDGGFPLRLERMDGAGVITASAAIEKARTAAFIGAPTQLLAQRLPAELELLRLTDLLPMQGGLPILAGGACAGGLGVSGGAPPQDDEIGTAGLAAIAGL